MCSSQGVAEGYEGRSNGICEMVSDRVHGDVVA